MTLYRHKIEAELLRKEEMEAIGIFSIGIVHDFNNLLQIIGGLIEGAAKNYSVVGSERKCMSSLERAGGFWVPGKVF
jgi:hypothetical protein